MRAKPPPTKNAMARTACRLAQRRQIADALPMRLIDTHTHLDFPDFDADRAELLARCRALGVERLVVLGVHQGNWQRLWHLVQGDAGLYAAFGLHPVFLDRHRQQTLFEAQLQLALEFELPVLLHVRRAHAVTIATLKRLKPPRGGIIHAFSGSYEEAREYLKLGFKLGLGGAPTWPQARRLQQTLARLPLEAVVLETDAPDMAPAMHPHQRNSPEYLPEICAELARVMGVTAEQLAEASSRNAEELFGWEL